MEARITNWAGNVVFTARDCRFPSSVGELQSIVHDASELRVLGTGHSFSTIADSPALLISVANLPETVEIDDASSTVRCSAGMRYAQLSAALERSGRALHNLGSLPHISVAGACATGTHGSGRDNGNLATAVRAVEFVDATGEIVRLSLDANPGHFDGAVLALGALGVVTHLEIATEPSFTVRQVVYEGLGAGAASAHLDEILDRAYSVSMFTTWRSLDFDQVWCKYRVGDGELDVNAPLFGAPPATSPRNPLAGMPPQNCTEQLGIAGPWNARLPHFRAEFTPSVGDELQSEYLVGRESASAALEAVASIAPRLAPLLLISEIRSIAADRLWMSPSYGRDSVAFHFTWAKEPELLAPVLRELESVLAPFEPRPHWGKVFSIDPATVRSRYARVDDFIALCARYDPKGKFRNTFVDRYLDAP